MEAEDDREGEEEVAEEEEEGVNGGEGGGRAVGAGAGGAVVTVPVMEGAPVVGVEGVAEGEAGLDFEAGVEFEDDSRGRKSLVCPLCSVPFRATLFLGHINNFHIVA